MAVWILIGLLRGILQVSCSHSRMDFILKLNTWMARGMGTEVSRRRAGS